MNILPKKSKSKPAPTNTEMAGKMTPDTASKTVHRCRARYDVVIHDETLPEADSIQAADEMDEITRAIETTAPIEAAAREQRIAALTDEIIVRQKEQAVLSQEAAAWRSVAGDANCFRLNYLPDLRKPRPHHQVLAIESADSIESLKAQVMELARQLAGMPAPAVKPERTDAIVPTPAQAAANIAKREALFAEADQRRIEQEERDQRQEANRAANAKQIIEQKTAEARIEKWMSGDATAFKEVAE